MAELPLQIQRRELGLRLHAAEATIGVGRQAIKKIVKCEPIDETAIQEWHVQMSAARAERRAVLPKLTAAKQALELAGYRPMPSYHWTVRG